MTQARRKIVTDFTGSLVRRLQTDGCVVLFHEEGLFALPAYPVTELRDPTGAGDSFAGALLGYLASVGSTDFATLKQAMVYGTAVASLTVEAFSTDRLAKTGCREIRARRKALLKLIKA